MCILVARDRSGQTLDWMAGKGPVTSTQLHEHLKGRLEPDVLPVTDAHAAYRAFAREAGISHEAVHVKAGGRPGQNAGRLAASGARRAKPGDGPHLTRTAPLLYAGRSACSNFGAAGRSNSVPRHP
jgi:hypothetical protein